jgi:hypothetical protein
LAYGVAEDLFFGDEKFLNCVAKKMVDDRPEEPIEEASNEVELNVNPMLSGLKMVRDFAVKIIKYTCSQRKLVLEFIDRIFLFRRLKKYRLMEQNLSKQEFPSSEPND